MTLKCDKVIYTVYNFSKISGMFTPNCTCMYMTSTRCDMCLHYLCTYICNYIKT